MALPWGSNSSLPLEALAGGVRVDVVALAASGASDPISSFRRLFRASALPLVDGSFSAPPGTGYEIEVKVDAAPTNGSVYVVRGSIDGHEINEQIILRTGGRVAKFVGWLQDPTGAKRTRFTFPARGEAVVTIGVFTATELNQSGKSAKQHTPQPPANALGETFSGPLVGNSAFTIGQPVGAGMIRLRASA